MYGRKKIFDDRNGADVLSVFLITSGIVIALAGPIFSKLYISIIFYIVGASLIIYGIYRSFSKNIVRREKENKAFVSFFKSAPKKEKTKKYKKNKVENAKYEEKVKSEDEFVFFFCPECNAKLRIPKGRGKIKIKCPKCSTTFEETT